MRFLADSMSSKQKIIVIGSGIIGISVGLALHEVGFHVRIIDEPGSTPKASEGNAGAFAFSDIVPLATPGIMRSAPSWLIDPLGPLSIPPSYAFSIAPWLMKFWRASWSDKFPALLEAQAELMALSRSALDRQAAAHRGEALLRREGQLRLYDTERNFLESASYWSACKEFGISYTLLTSHDEINELQPGLHKRFKYAGYTPDWVNVCDPKLWLRNLYDRFVFGGGFVEQRRARSLSFSSDTVIVRCDDDDLYCDFVVVAAGAWSKSLARTVGDNIPLETERGYNTTFDPGDFDLRTHLTFADHGFVVSKVGESMRVGGAVELGGLKAPPNFERSRILLSKAKQFLPSIDTIGCQEWMGFRPSMPDSLPVIGASPKQSKVVYAFGHGHLGLTQSAATAELVRATILGEPWPISSAPFSAARFMPQSSI